MYCTVRPLILLIPLLGSFLSVYHHSYAQIQISHASFAHNDRESLVELYFSVEGDVLKFVSSDSVYTAVVPLHIRLLNSLNSTDRVLKEISQESHLYFTVDDTSAFHRDQLFLQKQSITVAPGEYELHANLEMSELDPIHIMKSLSIPDFNQRQSVSISDIILASSIVDTIDEDAPFFKNGMSVFPKVDQFYDDEMNELFYYVEVYHRINSISNGENYTWHVYVRDANTSAPIGDLQIHRTHSKRALDVIMGSFDLDSLSSGTYALHVEILDKTDETVVQKSRKFYRFNPLVNMSSEPTHTLVEESIFALMSTEQIDLEFDQIRQIATRHELSRMKRAKSSDQRRRLLKELWDVRDPTPQTQVNELRNDFIGLVEYANEHFSFQRIEGWESDRGRILLDYGNPSEKEMHLYERGLHPYEIWKYNEISKEGDAEFVFVDKSGIGEFELLHSTVSGERKLHDWYQRISDRY